MTKLQTGISTNMDFIKLMKEKGQDVNAEFPAETLRTQLDLVSDTVKVTFNSTNETILEATNNEEPIEEVTITFNVDGVDSSDEVMVTIGDEVITTLPATLTENKGTELSYSVSCTGYNTEEGTLVFDENKEVTITLERVDVTITFNVDGFEQGEEPQVTIGEEVITTLPVELTEISGTELPYTVSLDGYQTQEGTLVFDENKSVTITLEPSIYYTLELDLNGSYASGSGEPIECLSYDDGETVDLAQDSNVVSIANAISSQNKPFYANSLIGWSTVIDDESSQVNTVTMDSDKTIYALWDMYTGVNAESEVDFDELCFATSATAQASTADGAYMYIVAGSTGVFADGLFVFHRATTERNARYTLDIGQAGTEYHLHAEFETPQSGELDSTEIFEFKPELSYIDYGNEHTEFASLRPHKDSTGMYAYPTTIASSYSASSASISELDEAFESLIGFISVQ